MEDICRGHPNTLLYSTFFPSLITTIVHLFIALIVAHVGGVLVDRVLHKKQETLNSIVTGYKITSENESIKLNIYQKMFSLLIFIPAINKG